MKKRILIVDDSATIRQQLCSFLEQRGYDVVEAENGASGLDRMKLESIDLVIVDVNMPVMGGIEMTERARQLAAYAHTPIFVLTTDAAGNSVKRGKTAGATAWIVKPFNPEVLLQGIEKVLASTAK